MENKKSWRNSARYQLTFRFTLLLSAAILLLSLSIIVVLTRQLYDSTKNQAELLTETMEKADTGNQAEWLDFLETYTSGDSSPYFVQVSLSSGEKIYSQEAKLLFGGFSEMRQLIFVKNIFWTRDGDPYFYTTVTKDGAAAAVLVDMEDQFELIQGVLALTIILTVAILFIATIFIYRFAGVFSRPLRVMNEEIGQLGKEGPSGELTVPSTPQEVKYVSESFNELLEKQRKSLEREQQFVTDVSHELRTPLAAIRGHIDLIKRRGENHPEVIPKSITYIDKESKRMTIMIEQLLVLGRLARGNTVIDFSEELRQTIEDLGVMIPQSKILDIEEQVSMTANPEHLRQIIRNLIENAGKYSESTDTIMIRLAQTTDWIEFEVADTGPGISEEDKQRIFDRFYRADRSRSSKIGGSGIGLAIVMELVHLYEGDIQVLDNRPTGSRFIVHFPIKK